MICLSRLKPTSASDVGKSECSFGVLLACTLLAVCGCGMNYKFAIDADVLGMLGDELPSERYHLASLCRFRETRDGRAGLYGTDADFLDMVVTNASSVVSESGVNVGLVYHESKILSDSSTRWLMLLTLGIAPNIGSQSRSQRVDVVREDGATESYDLRWRENWFCSLLRLNLFFPFSQTDEDGYCVVGNSWWLQPELPIDECCAKASAKGVRMALARLEACSKTNSPSQGVDQRIRSGSLKILKMTELKLLCEDGVISEDEYKCEVERLQGEEGWRNERSASGKSETRLDIYVVRSGDTLRSIVDAHGMTVQEVRSLNSLSSDLLHVGQKLYVRKDK